MNGHIDLADPFDVADVEWRLGASSRDKAKGLVTYYINARAVMNRLDAYCSETGGTWQTAYAPHPNGKNVECRLTVDLPITRGGDEATLVAVTRADVGEPSQGMGDALKGAYSSALKRAAAQFGIGRYLYDIADIWLPVEKRGNSHRLTDAGQRQAREHYASFASNIGKPRTQREQQPDAEVAVKAQGARQTAQSGKTVNWTAWWNSMKQLNLTPDYVRNYVKPKDIQTYSQDELTALYAELVRHVQNGAAA